MLGLGGLGSGNAHAVVVVHFLDGDLGALLGDVVKAGLAGALGHVHHSLLAQLVGCPGNAASVVSVGGCEEGGLAELLAQLVGGEHRVGQLGNVFSGLLSDVAGHCEGTAQHLECV